MSPAASRASFERDFYIDLGDMTQDVDTRTTSVAEQMGAVNYFAGYMNTDQHAAVPFSINDNSNIEVGFGRSDAQYLGNSFSGTLGTTTDSNTVYANYNYRNGGFFAQAGVGYTDVNFDNPPRLGRARDQSRPGPWTGPGPWQWSHHPALGQGPGCGQGT